MWSSSHQDSSQYRKYFLPTTCSGHNNTGVLCKNLHATQTSTSFKYMIQEVFITHFCLHVTDTKLKFTTYPLTMGQTQEMPLAISIAEQDVVKYLKQRQQETGIHYIKVHRNVQL